jgi:hypothetical protein
MFWVNVPFCVAGLILAARFMPADKPAAPGQTARAAARRRQAGCGTAVLAVILSAAITTRRGGLATGFDIAFWWATGFSAVAVLLSFWLPGGSHRAWRFLPHSVHLAVLGWRGDIRRRR